MMRRSSHRWRFPWLLVGPAFVVFASCIAPLVKFWSRFKIPADTLTVSEAPVVYQGQHATIGLQIPADTLTVSEEPTVDQGQHATIGLQRRITVNMTIGKRHIALPFDLNEQGGLLLKRSASESTSMEKRVEVSARGKVMYAVFTSAVPKYRETLQAARETWGAAVASEGRFFAVGGTGYPQQGLEKDIIMMSGCPDWMLGICCKEIALIAEGWKRGASWLFITGEDAYIDTREIDKTLQSFNADDAVALGQIGCGLHKNLWCEAVQDNGGFCGGAGYALSRESMRRLLEHGLTALLKEYYRPGIYVPNDVGTSCALRARKVAMKELTWTFWGNRLFRKIQYLRKINSTYLHYVRAPTMRWLHAVKTGSSAKITKDLEMKAFFRDCAIQNNTTRLQADWTACLSR